MAAEVLEAATEAEAMAAEVSAVATEAEAMAVAATEAAMEAEAMVVEVSEAATEAEAMAEVAMAEVTPWSRCSARRRRLLAQVAAPTTKIEAYMKKNLATTHSER